MLQLQLCDPHHAGRYARTTRNSAPMSLGLGNALSPSLHAERPRRCAVGREVDIALLRDRARLVAHQLGEVTGSIPRAIIRLAKAWRMSWNGDALDPGFCGCGFEAAAGDVPVPERLCPPWRRTRVLRRRSGRTELQLAEELGTSLGRERDPANACRGLRRPVTRSGGATAAGRRARPRGSRCPPTAARAARRGAGRCTGRCG